MKKLISLTVIINLFKKLRDEGKTIIVVHHDLFTAPTYFDHVMLLNKTCIACGPTANILTPAYLECTYGTNFAPFDTFFEDKKHSGRAEEKFLE